MNHSVVASYLLAALAVFLVLHFHLLPAAVAGLAVHVLTARLAARLPSHWRSGRTFTMALFLIAITVALVLLGLGVGVWAFLNGTELSSLLTATAGTLENLQRMVPPEIARAVPTTVDEIREQLARLMREHGKRLSAAGLEGVRFFAHALLGMVIGGMTVLHPFRSAEERPRLALALHRRCSTLAEAFEKVVYAQVIISAVNTALTALYLLAVLPLTGVRLPMPAILVVLTFICGLLPVVGNLLSNTVIVLLSLTVSPGAGIGSVIFLLAIHKLEYFTNAKIVGGRVEASAWELLASMLLMEAIFGIGGLVAAPIVYAWIKEELRVKGMI